MTPKEFCYFLKGILSLSPKELSEAQTKLVRDALDSVFEHVAEKPEVEPKSKPKSKPKSEPTSLDQQLLEEFVKWKKNHPQNTFPWMYPKDYIEQIPTIPKPNHDEIHYRC